jgi:dethiobiotin synthetase
VKSGFFITGTDTKIGKTKVACDLLQLLSHQGFKVAGLKPVACEREDIVRLKQAANVDLPDHVINAIFFDEPIAPHIAAKKNAICLDVTQLHSKIAEVYQYPLDYVIVEGCGGWEVPLNPQQTMADLAVALDLPVIMVVGIRLGCLNHAFLTYRAMKASNVKIAGWFANCIEPHMPYWQENISTLQEYLPPPLLGVCEYAAETRWVVEFRDKFVSL